MNIYLRALEIGSEHLTQGARYSYIKEQIENEFNFEFSPNGETNFIIWFYDNFSDGRSISSKLRSDHNFLPHLIASLRNPESKRPNHLRSHSYIKHLYENNFYVNGIGNKQYVEYKELTEARESSEKALRKANTSIKLNIISIVIAILALGITAYYSHKAYYKPDPLYPVPPYEVKINQPVKINDESINKIRVLTKDSIQ